MSEEATQAILMELKNLELRMTEKIQRALRDHSTDCPTRFNMRMLLQVAGISAGLSTAVTTVINIFN